MCEAGQADHAARAHADSGRRARLPACPVRRRGVRGSRGGQGTSHQARGRSARKRTRGVHHGWPWHVKRPDTSRAAGGTDGEEEKISRCAVAGRGGESMDSSALKRPHRTAGWLPAAVGRSVAGSPRPEPGGVAACSPAGDTETGRMAWSSDDDEPGGCCFTVPALAAAPRSIVYHAAGVQSWLPANPGWHRNSGQ
jgi:hypothetical protein